MPEDLPDNMPEDMPDKISPGKRIGNLVFKIYQNISPSKPNSLREPVSLQTWVTAWG